MKRFLSVIAVFFLCLAIWAQTKPNGSGTKADPWRITSLSDLKYVDKYSTDDNYSVLTQDISLVSVCGPAFGDWTPLGVNTKTWPNGETTHMGFHGVLDGQGHSIGTVYIHDSDVAGLFYCVYGTIRNLNVTVNYNTRIGADGYISAAGGIAALLLGTLENCTVTGNISTSETMGGVVGWAGRSSHIVRCTNKANLSNHSPTATPNTVGGIVGAMCSEVPGLPAAYAQDYPLFGGSYGEVTGCVNEGEVKANTDAGGICGLATPLISHTLISDCKNIGHITGIHVGGILGRLKPEQNGLYRVVRTLNMGDIMSYSSDINNIGLCVGRNTNIVLEDCYSASTVVAQWGMSTGALARLYGGEKYSCDNRFMPTADELKSGKITYELQHNRENVVWSQRLTRETEPNLITNQNGITYRVVADGDVLDCEGKHVGNITGYRNSTTNDITILPHQYEDDFCSLCHRGKPAMLVNGQYKIASLGNLVWLRDCIAEDPSALATHDAFLSQSISLSTLGDDWGAIGTPTSPYMGTFDGNRHTISGLTFNHAYDEKHNGGLFGHVKNATISNLNVQGTSTTSGGGLIAYQAQNSNFTNCRVSGSFTASVSTEAAGGLVGHSVGCSYVECINNAEIRSVGAIGGVAGLSEGEGNNSLRNCASYSTLQYTSQYPKPVNALIVPQAGQDVIISCVAYQDSSNKYIYYDAQGQEHAQTKEAMENGVITYALGSTRWGQALGYDPYPVLDGLRVYRHYCLNCRDRIITSEPYYTNDSEEVRYSTSNLHNYDTENRCTRCLRIKKYGDGYYHLYTPRDLSWFSTIVAESESNACAKLMCDIDLTGYTYENEDGSTGWIPIGSVDTPYSGVFLGNGHIIRGLTIQGDDKHKALGFFGKIANTHSEAAVRDLTVEAEMDDVKGTSCGIVAGVITKGSMDNVTARGFICGYSTNAKYIGGIVGDLGTGVSITHSTNQARVLSNGDYTGGIAGMCRGDIVCCINEGCVECTSTSAVGGIAGVLSGTCTDVANLGEVVGCDYTGGLTGNQASYATITRGYSIGCVTGIKNCHAVTGRQSSTTGNNVISVYFDAEQCGTNDTYGTNCSSALFECGQVAYLLGNPWGQSIGQDKYPVLNGPTVYRYEGECICYDNSSEPEGNAGHSYANGVCAFCGHTQTLEQDSEGYYLIANATNLVLFCEMVNNGAYDINARVIRDFSMKNVCGAGIRSWTPIGGNSTSTGYCGTFDGQGHTISDLYINSTSTGQGLFGYTYNNTVSTTMGATLRNIHVQGHITVGGTSGMLCAYARHSTLQNCSTSGSVTVANGSSSSSNVGGLCGVAYGSDYISGCTNRANLSCSITTNYLGGIVGYARSPIDRCINKGRISAPNSRNVGGITGHVQMPVTNCGNQGSIYFGINGAGIAGEYTASTEISNCYNTGTITSDNTTLLPAIIPYYVNTPSADITHCYHIDGRGITDINSQPMSANAFAGGEVAYLLQQQCGDVPTWGQTLTGEGSYPEPDATPVLRHTLDLPNWVSDNRGIPSSVSRYDWSLHTGSYALVKVSLDWTVSSDATDYLWVGAGKNDDLVMGIYGEHSGHAEYEEYTSKVFSLYIGYTKDQDYEDYDDEATVSNIHLEWYSNVPYYSLHNQSLLPGDINADGRRSIGDVARMVAILNGTLTDINHSADMNYDGAIDIQDLNELVKVVRDNR